MSPPAEQLNPDQIIQVAEAFLKAHPPEQAPLYSTEEYMRMTLQACLEALNLGNYGIGAVLIVRKNGQELIFKGLNTLHSDGLYRGHAEFNALEAFYQYLITPDEQKKEYLSQAQVVVREAPHNLRETIIFSSLEPCIMCTGGIINVKINTVVYAHQDEGAGFIAPQRLAQAPKWFEIARNQGLKTFVCNPDSPEEIAQATPDLLSLLDSIYQASRLIMRQRLEQSGFRGKSPDN